MKARKISHLEINNILKNFSNIENSKSCSVKNQKFFEKVIDSLNKNRCKYNKIKVNLKNCKRISIIAHRILKCRKSVIMDSKKT